MTCRRLSSQILFFFLFVILSTAAVSAQPRLIVLLSIDQMRAEHLVRFAPLYEQGFKRLIRDGVYFRNADLNYAGTSTGPGHATLATGVYPWKNGIVANNYIERLTGQKVYCVADSTAQKVDGEGGSMSPRNLLATGFGDWLKAASPRSKVISLSYKDRAAILMGGKGPDAAFWYDRKSGRMASSSFYMATLPDWARRFDGGVWRSQHLPNLWNRLRADSVYTRFGPDDMAGEHPWQGKRTFPHAIEPGKEIGLLFSTPWGNDFLLDFARAAIRGEQLGKRGPVDLLCISLSTTDNIGGDFGPDSHEMIDNLLRLDLALGGFLSDLDTTFGREGYMLALTGDHGVMPLPEYAVAYRREIARRLDNSQDVERVLKQVDSTFRKELGITDRIIKRGMINYAALGATGTSPRLVEQRLREKLLTVDGVSDVYFRSELLDPSTAPRPYLDLYRHSYLEGRSPDYLIRDCEYCLSGTESTGTSHGSPYEYDTRVPLVFLGTGKPAQSVERVVHPVDLVATIARLYGIPVPAGIDGVPLQEVVEK